VATSNVDRDDASGSVVALPSDVNKSYCVDELVLGSSRYRFFFRTARLSLMAYRRRIMAMAEHIREDESGIAQENRCGRALAAFYL